MGEKRSRSIDEVLAGLDKVSRRGDKRWAARCPAHDDRSPSLSIGIGDRGITLKCHSGCTFEAIAEALGFRPEELFDDEPYQKGERGPVGGRRPPPGKKEKPRATGCSLAELAEAKRLPLAHLQRFGARDTIWRGLKSVAFPSVQGGRTHIRKAVGDAADKWAWDDDAPGIVAYDPDRGELARHARQLVVVEGEIDTLTLLYAGFGALGIPGANMTTKLEREHLQGIDDVFVVQENDASGAGARFAVDVRTRIEGALGFVGGVHVVRLPESAKDTNELYLAEQAGFGNAFQALLERSVEPPKVRAKSALELVDSQASDGVAHATGIAQLDASFTLKGLPSGRLVCLLGQPGAGKSAFALQLSDVMTRAGAVGMFFASDEDRQNLQTRLGQRHGLNRLSLIAPRGDAIGDAVRALQKQREAALERTLLFVDPAEEDEPSTVEAAHADLLRVARGRPRVLVIDSLQTAPFAVEELVKGGDARAVVNAKLAVLHRLKKTGTTIILLSETNRAFYASASTEAEEVARVLAGARESGNVEFKADMLVGLFSVPGEENADLTKLVVAKNRFGHKGTKLVLRWDWAGSNLHELEAGEEPPSAPEPVVGRTRAEPPSGLRTEVLKHLHLKPGATARETRAALATARPKGIGIEPVQRALDELCEQRLVLVRDEPRRRRAYYPMGVEQ